MDLSEEVLAVLKYPLGTGHEFSFHADISFCFVKTLTTCHVSGNQKKEGKPLLACFFFSFFKRLSSPFAVCCVCNQARIKDWRLVSFAHNLAPPDICKDLSAFFVQFLFS